MTGVFLAPHNDDEALFGAYTLLRHKPEVVIVLRCQPWPQRFEESVKGCYVLGVGHVTQWSELESAPDWKRTAEKIASLVGHVWAPYPEPAGHAHHNRVGELAVDLIEPERLTLYTTYSLTARTVGDLVVPEPGWENLKLEALMAYASQESRLAAHLARGTDEYVA